jgi:hypothetical protein
MPIEKIVADAALSAGTDPVGLGMFHLRLSGFVTRRPFIQDVRVCLASYVFRWV